MRAVASANSVDLRPRALDSDPAPSVMLAPTWPMNKMDSLSGCYLLGEPSDRKLIGVAASIAGKPFDSNARTHTDLLGVGQRNRLQLRPPRARTIERLHRGRLRRRRKLSPIR